MIKIIKNRIDKRRNALEQIKRLNDNPKNVLIIHYSCESFYNIDNGRTPRITSIAAKYMETGQTKSFSIHKIAEIEKVNVGEIHEKYDELEKLMLLEFFKFVGKHINYTWVHWNMRNINYGFQAIENRYKVLGGDPIIIEDNNKMDLSRILRSIYGLNYIKDPKLEKLIEKNQINNTDFLKGADEASAFENKEYVKLHRSTLRKVDCMETILTKVSSNKLKTNAKITDIYSFTPQGIFELSQDNWFVNLFFVGIGLLIGYLLGK